MRLVTTAVVFILILGFGAESRARQSASPAVPTPDHIVIVIEENKAYSDIVGSVDAPYINSLVSAGASFTQSHGVTHPSQPNYLAFFSGSTQGIFTDSVSPSGSPYSAPNLGGELIAAGKTFAGYSEDLPYTGFTGGSSGGYRRKHNPWVDFSDVPASANLPWTSFPTDYSTLPTVSIVAPNLTHDMHDGTINQGDVWLQTNLSGYATWAATHNSLLIVTWDEDDGLIPFLSTNHIPTIFHGPMVASGSYVANINHYNVLRTIEDMYGLPHAGSSATAVPITDCWTTSPAPGPGPTPTTPPPPPPACGLVGFEAVLLLSLFRLPRRH